ncbi:hypothetical protein BT69DRAFT_1281671 [Atractiella rhizophila]|nr:hypothetical protein BT69DRAFT_1281671 [Atractiella rhizophila]
MSNRPSYAALTSLSSLPTLQLGSKVRFLARVLTSSPSSASLLLTSPLSPSSPPSIVCSCTSYIENSALSITLPAPKGLIMVVGEISEMGENDLMKMNELKKEKKGRRLPFDLPEVWEGGQVCAIWIRELGEGEVDVQKWEDGVTAVREGRS